MEEEKNNQIENKEGESEGYNNQEAQNMSEEQTVQQENSWQTSSQEGVFEQENEKKEGSQDAFSQQDSTWQQAEQKNDTENDNVNNGNLDDKNQFFRPEVVEGSPGGKKDKLNSTYVLLAIFIALLAVSYVIKNKSLDANKMGQDQKIVAEIESETINKVEITKGEQITVIENNDDVWKLSSENNIPADKEAIESLIEESLNLNKYIIASENQEKQIDFEVDDENGTNVKLYKENEEIANFYVGKAGPDFDSTYIRNASEDIVYLSKGYVRFYFDRDEWADLSIYNFESGSAVKLALKYRDVAKNIEMQKEGDVWQIKAPKAKEANKETVDAILNSIGALNANGIVMGKNLKECGFDKAPLVVRLELADGSKRNLFIGGKMEDDGKYYTKREEDDMVYIIDASIAENLMKEIGDF